MKNKLVKFLIPLTLLPLIACGQTNGSSKTTSAPAVGSAVSAKPAGGNVVETVKAKLEKTYAGQNLKVVSVSETPLKGIYEVIVTGKQVIYTDASGDYMLVGDLIDINKRQSITEERIAELNKIDFSTLPLDKAIKEVRGNGKLKIAVFSDPDCPFCKKLEHEFPKINNITIYNFMMPIPSLHPDAERKAVQIWCQKDRTSAWLAWMRQGKQPAQVADCPNPVAETTALGNRFGFNGTPTLVFPNGKVQSGYAPMPHLQEAIEANQK